MIGNILSLLLPMPLVFERPEAITLSHLIQHGKKQLSLFTRIKLALDIAEGLNWLHSGNSSIIVGNLSASNFPPSRFAVMPLLQQKPF